MTHAIRRRRAGTAITLSLALGMSLFAPFAANAEEAQPAADPSVAAAPAAQTGTAEATGTLQETHADGTPSEVAADTTPVPAPPYTANEAVHRTETGAPVAVPARPSVEGAAGDGGAPGTGAPGAEGDASDETCEISSFSSASGAALVDEVTSHSTSCINSLFLLTGSDAGAVFAEAKMVSVANGLRDVAQSYPGDNSTFAAQLILFLRAGYFVQWYHADEVGEYGQALSDATAGALDAFFGNPRSRDVTDANGESLSEAVILIDSAQLNARYLSVVKQLLTGYDEQVDASWWMRNATNNVFTVLFRGHQVPAFVQAVAADPSVLRLLHEFTIEHLDLLGTDSAFLTSNAARELGRFLGDADVRPTAKPLVIDLMGRTSIHDETAPIWAGLADMAKYYEPDACADYGTCDVAEKVAAAILTGRHDCGGGIVIRSQALSAAEVENSCSSLLGQDRYFHAVAKDPGQVPDDLNQQIEVVVFDSSRDYQSYAGLVFDIDTNNGGMYLEGDPTVAGNTPRFIAYEAEWQRPVFAVWNLNHEYTHYLDGRFNMHGDFEEGMQTPTIWWVEGFAEYISYHYRGLENTAAEQIAARGTYRLSELFDTGYGDQDRVYRWGYLATAFMLNEHPNELQTILGSYRSGDWNAARSYITNSIGTSYDAEFSAYLTRCASGDCGEELGGDTRNLVPTAAFTATSDGLSAKLRDASTDSDGRIVAWAWTFGDGQTSNEQHPTVSYEQAGAYTVTLSVTDDLGAVASSAQSVEVGGDGTTPTLPECSSADLRQLDQGCVRSGRSATTGQIDHLFVWIPENTPQLTVTTSGGSGNADLYVNCYDWATPDAYVSRSANADSTEAVTVAWPRPGWNFVSLVGASDFSGVSVAVSY